MENGNESGLIGIKEIARRANVSIGTVDRVIHNRRGVSEETKKRVKDIINEINYQPNLLAQRLASRKTLRLATLIPMGSRETSFWNAPLQGIDQAIAEVYHFGVIVEKYFYDQNSISSFVDQTKLILKSRPDGLLLAPSFIEESVAFTTQCTRLKIPYVLIDSDLPNKESLTYIGPNLYHSGYLGAHLVSYLIKESDKVLIVNISKEIDKYHHLLKKEEGFRAYFDIKNRAGSVVKVDINQTDFPSIEQYLNYEFKKTDDIKVVFVTNSRVSGVAHYLEKTEKDVILIGYDYLEENLDYLKKGIIDFLICQKPMEQAYKGVMALYQYLAFATPVEKIHFMPIDIITRENYSFYKN
jgi:LacI family transcriptional regulator